ncbi:hypothetical protein [Streptomyces sp. NPDC057582]|uniref:hypothetical protein n=1 Tax=Streptomyces sp. NPDC057582 TaxID=3346174 RepID=UPI0036A61275
MAQVLPAAIDMQAEGFRPRPDGRVVGVQGARRLLVDLTYARYGQKEEPEVATESLLAKRCGAITDVRIDVEGCRAASQRARPGSSIEEGEYTVSDSDIWRHAEALADEGRYDEARKVYLDAMAQGVTGAGVEYAVALLEWGQDRQEAERLLRASLAADEDWNADEHLAVLLRTTGRVDEAEDLLRARLAQPGNLHLARHLGHVLADDRAGKRAEAEQWYRTALADGDPKAANDLAMFLAEEPERTAEARNLLTQAYLAGDGMAAGNFGGIAWEDGDLGEARRWFTIAVEAGVTQRLLSLALLEDENDAPDKAVAYLRQAIHARVPGAHTAYAQHLADHGEPSELIVAAFDVAFQTDDEDADYWYAAWLEEHDRPEEALRLYRHSADRGNCNAFLRVAYVAQDLDQPALAEHYLRQGMAKGDADCAVELARLLHSTGHTKEIAQIVTRARELGATPEELAETETLTPGASPQ